MILLLPVLQKWQSSAKKLPLRQRLTAVRLGGNHDFVVITSRIEREERHAWRAPGGQIESAWLFRPINNADEAAAYTASS